MASQPRFATYAEFWPHYISEHRDARGRWLHFVGTTGFVTVLCVCIAQAPLRMGVALALGALLVWGTVDRAFQGESGEFVPVLDFDVNGIPVGLNNSRRYEWDHHKYQGGFLAGLVSPEFEGPRHRAQALRMRHHRNQSASVSG